MFCFVQLRNFNPNASPNPSSSRKKKIYFSKLPKRTEERNGLTEDGTTERNRKGYHELDLNRRRRNYAINALFMDNDNTEPNNIDYIDNSQRNMNTKEKEDLYEAYNQLHTLAQDFHKPFDAPAVIVVGHQTSGKSALIEALMGFQFNQVGGGTKTRRPVALRMQYNPSCTSIKEVTSS